MLDLSGDIPTIEVYRAYARIGKYKGDGIFVWLIKYNGRIHEGGWAHKEKAIAYAAKLSDGLVEPKLLPANVTI